MTRHDLAELGTHPGLPLTRHSGIKAPGRLAKVRKTALHPELRGRLARRAGPAGGWFGPARAYAAPSSCSSARSSPAETSLPRQAVMTHLKPAASGPLRP